MNKQSNSLTFICGAGSQLAWIYGCASFIIYAFFQQIYPLPETVGIFCLASAITLVYRGRGWRRVLIILMHAGAVLISALWIVYVFYEFPGLWWEPSWLGDFFRLPRGRGDWMLLFFVVTYTVVFYIMGVRFAHETTSYTVACSRFDRGLVAFFGLFLFRLVVNYRFEIAFDDSLSYLMVFPFFIFSLMEIGLARNSEAKHRKRYLSGYHVIGLSASFVAGTFIFCAGIFIFFLPYLNMASEAGYDLMKTAAAPLEPILISVLKFIFGHADWRQSATGSSPSTGVAGLPTSNAFLLLVQSILTWRNGIILIILGIGIALLFLGFLLRWLFQNRDDQSHPIAALNFLSWWYRLKALLFIFFQWIFRSRAKRTAIQYYTALQRWGRFSGYSSRQEETPNEYARRLSRQFPLLRDEFMLIIDMLHREVYGEATLNADQIARIRKSWKKLLHPSIWPLRLKAMMKTP